MRPPAAAFVAILLACGFAPADDVEPYNVDLNSPKLTTPQWIGEDGVEAVVILSIDDMSESGAYENFLRPILDRLKQIDGRAAVSIMSCRPEANDPQLQRWLKEGVSFESHTFDHPCPLLAGGDLPKAKSTFDRCVDRLFEIPGNVPVAFRMPCCDSKNTVSPRFFAEIFNKTTPGDHRVAIDSSVFNITTPADPDLPRELVLDDKGIERFRKYVPFESYVNTIENYPYPYRIGESCWEFPCATPSDWQGQHLHGVNSAKTVEDWKAAIDATVIKRGVFTLVFHPHGWIKSEQIVELIDHAVAKHGKKIKFLTFKEAHERLAKAQVAPDPRLRLREGPDLPEGISIDEATRLIDLDNDGDRDVIHSEEKTYSLHLAEPSGWKKVISGTRGDGNPREIPMIARHGTNNGAFFHSRHLWIVNEDTDKFPNHADRRSFAELLADVEPQPLSPEASLRAMQPRPGFTVELMAAEPMVMDPIAFAWGADGKFWVVEMGSYPTGQRDGRVKFLEDIDNDGRYDKSTVFLDNLSFPTSVLPWRNGVLIACAPDIFFARDTDGDGHADIREVLFTGFGEGNPQHRVNSLTYGLDNWIYAANGDSGGTIKSIKTGQEFDIRGRDFRFNPDSGAFDPQSGQSQFGRNRDDYNDYFGCNNADPMYHFVLPDHYMRRNPHVPAPESRVRVSQTPGAAPVFPISRTLPRFNDPHTANHFTSACSAMVYRDDLFGPHFAGNVFISEPVHNLIHREIMSPTGCTFTSRRADDERDREFLASTDNWFRPAMIATGPDGALWIADMYRAVIEHPEWIPPDVQKRLDLRAGHDKGRIYRVYPIEKKPRMIPRLDQFSTTQLVAALDSPSGWQRDTAQRLLVHANDPQAVELLERLARTSDRPLARLHALATLEGMNALREVTLLNAIHLSEPSLRRHIIRMCEPLLDSSPPLTQQLMILWQGIDGPVALQLAFTLGQTNSRHTSGALSALLMSKDPHISAAALSSLHEGNLSAVVSDMLSRGGLQSISPATLANVLRTALAMRHQAGDVLLDAVTSPRDGQFAAWQFETIQPVLSAVPAEHPIRAAAQKIARDDASATALRIAAVALVDNLELLAGLLTPRSPLELQQAAVQRIANVESPDAAAILLRNWKALGLSQRSAVLDALLARPAWTHSLIDSLQRGEIAAAEIDATHRQQLLQRDDAGLRARVEKLLADSIKPDRRKVLDAFAPAATLAGDASRGAALFTKLCATCHQYNGVGRVVGPDFKSLADKSPQALLVAILDPNRAVEAKFTNYVADLTDGQVLTGILSAETGTSITLLGSDAKPQQILRSNLKNLRSQGISLMPENLEAGLAPQDLADLIAFIRS